jgi:hypothetical protein
MAQQLLDKLNYHKSLTSSTNAITNLQRINPKLNENNILTHAYLVSNPAISDEEREIYLKCLRVKAIQDYEKFSKEIDRILERKALREIENN